MREPVGPGAPTVPDPATPAGAVTGAAPGADGRRSESGASRRAASVAAWRRPETWITLLIVMLDQLSKLLVLQRIALHETIPVIPGLLNLTYVRNTGAAFGMLNAQDFAYKPLVVAALALGALFGILWYARTFAGESWAARYGFVLIVAGAVGNLIDRLTLGFVVDFVDFYVGSWHFWAFNVADAAITVGATLFIADTLFPRRHVPEAV